jgi:hypothetical protein
MKKDESVIEGSIRFWETKRNDSVDREQRMENREKFERLQEVVAGRGRRRFSMAGISPG